MRYAVYGTLKILDKLSQYMQEATTLDDDSESGDVVMQDEVYLLSPKRKLPVDDTDADDYLRQAEVVSPKTRRTNHTVCGYLEHCRFVSTSLSICRKCPFRIRHQPRSPWRHPFELPIRT